MSKNGNIERRKGGSSCLPGRRQSSLSTYSYIGVHLMAGVRHGASRARGLPRMRRAQHQTGLSLSIPGLAQPLCHAKKLAARGDSRVLNSAGSRPGPWGFRATWRAERVARSVAWQRQVPIGGKPVCQYPVYGAAPTPGGGGQGFGGLGRAQSARPKPPSKGSPFPPQWEGGRGDGSHTCPERWSLACPRMNYTRENPHPWVAAGQWPSERPGCDPGDGGFWMHPAPRAGRGRGGTALLVGAGALEDGDVEQAEE